MSHKFVVPITGLHCKACEILTEDNLKKIKSIDAVSVDHKTGLAEITYNDERPEISAIAKNLQEIGYDMGSEPSLDSKQTKDNKKDFSYWFSVSAAIIIVYWLLSHASIIELDGMLPKNFSAPMSILIGLIAGVSTCLALVGGLVLSMSANFALNHPNASRSQKFRPQILFNVGRLIGFFILGGVLGLAGSFFKISSLANSIITIIIGIIIITLGLKLLEISPVFKKFDFSLPKKFGRITKINNPILLGVLTFFLPCGFTQAMQVYALGSNSFIEGAMIMTFFAIGTAPGLLGIGSISALINKKKNKAFFILAGILIIAFGLFNLTNGYNLLKISIGKNFSLLGFNNKQIENKKINISNTETDGDTQIIRMTESNRGYTPNKFTIIKGKPVKWIITAEAPYSCASALIVPSLEIQTQLKSGENIIEFTPEEVGEINFSCSMGMYSGKFIVVED